MFLINVRIVSLSVPQPACAACSVCAAHQRRLTALVVDDALLRLLGVELAQRAVLWILLDVPLPGPHPHPAGHAAGGPADPLGHHARRRLCRRGDGRTKSSVTSRAAAPPGSLLATRSLILSATNTATSSIQIENKYIKGIST